MCLIDLYLGFLLMKLLIKSLFIGIALSTTLFAKSPKYNQTMIDELNIIKHSFQTNYAPASWKKDLFGWDLQKEVDKASRKIKQLKHPTIKQFHHILRDFFASTRDYHVGIRFFSTESAKLPLQIREGSGRYFISYINRNAIPLDSDFPFNIGDEIVYFDDQPITNVVMDLKENEVGNNNLRTDCALAEFYLTSRLGRLGHIVPKGTVSLSGYQKGSDELITIDMEWNYTPEFISRPAMKSVTPLLKISNQEGVKTPKLYFLKEMMLPQYEDLATLHDDDDDAFDMLGTKKSYLPHLGEILWESDEDSIFHAYLFKMEGDKVGAYLRIATYSPDDTLKALDEFEGLVLLFQENADVLVIDQVNNPGGYATYMYALLSMLSVTPLDVPKHRMTLTQEDLYYADYHIPRLKEVTTDEEAEQALESLLPNLKPSMKIAGQVLGYFEFLEEEWYAGRTITRPYYLLGLGPLEPHAECFTKPILVIVNQLDVSAGDFFPAILQDNKRATIFGVKTSGAGGYILRQRFHNLHGVASYIYTGSIAERLDKQLIENHGVMPDILCHVTAYDLQNNYINYILKINKALEDLIKE